MSSYRFLFYSHTPRAWKPYLSMLHLELTIALQSCVGVEFRVSVWWIHDYGGNRLPSQGPISPSSAPSGAHVSRSGQETVRSPPVPLSRCASHFLSALLLGCRELEGSDSQTGIRIRINWKAVQTTFLGSIPRVVLLQIRLGSEHLQVLQVPKCCWCCQPGDPRAAP